VAIAIRRASAADAPAIGRVRVDCWRQTYRGVIPDAYLDAMDVEQSAALWQRVLETNAHGVDVFVAEHDRAIVGFAAANRLPDRRHDMNAELTAIYLQREFQRAGIGRRLVAAVARAQRDDGADGLIVWVIAANKAARAFYEQLGATLLVLQPFEWDGVEVVEAGYAFPDIDQLLLAAETAPVPGRAVVH
jgi:GNAT superfamily N-acetyltransferase